MGNSGSSPSQTVPQNVNTASPSPQPSAPVLPTIEPVKTALPEQVNQDAPVGPPQPPEPNPLFVNNPGTFEDLHKPCKEIFPQPFDGGRFTMNTGLSSHFQLSHTLTLGSQQTTGYRFGATYIGTHYGPQEAYPLLLGDIDANGNLNANLIHSLTDHIFVKCRAQIQSNKLEGTQGTIDYKGGSFTASLTAGNTDILNNSGILLAQYLQKCTSNLSLGTELMYQYGPEAPGGEVAICSFGGRLTGDKWACCGTVVPGAGGVHASYTHKITDALQLAAELETSLAMQGSVATVGYQMELPSAGVVFRGQLDTNWTVGSVIEKKLQPLPLTLALSAYANHSKASYIFGMGLTVG